MRRPTLPSDFPLDAVLGGVALIGLGPLVVAAAAVWVAVWARMAWGAVRLVWGL